MILIYIILLLYNIRAGTLKVALGTSHISLGVRLRGEKTWISCGTLVMILPEETVALQYRLDVPTTIPLITYIMHAPILEGERWLTAIGVAGLDCMRRSLT